MNSLLFGSILCEGGMTRILEDSKKVGWIYDNVFINKNTIVCIVS